MRLGDLAAERAERSGKDRSMREMPMLRSFVVAPIAAGMLALSIGASSAATLTHHYTFDGAAVTDAVGGVDGSLIGGASLSGGVLVLDGVDDYVQLAGKVVPTNLSAFSVTLFARQASAQTGVAELISQGLSNAPGFYIGHDDARNFRLGDQLINTGVAFPSDGAEHFYALTTGASGTIFYIDGALAFSSSGQLIPGNSNPGGSDTRIGRQFDPFGEFFHGTIDDLRIYSGVLTQDEINALRTRGGVVPEPVSIALMLLCLAGLGLARRARAST